MKTGYPSVLSLLIVSLSLWACGKSVTPTNTPISLTVESFTISPDPVERGGILTISWDVPGASNVTIRPMTWVGVSDGRPRWWYSGSLFPVVGSASGQVTVSVPLIAGPTFRFDLEAVGAADAIVTATAKINLKCYPSLTSDPDLLNCPSAPVSLTAVYQPFEQGVLIWRGDTQEIYILPNNPGYFPYWSLQAPVEQTASIPASPAGRYAPAERFAGLWSSLSVAVQERYFETPEALRTFEGQTLTVGKLLGWATGPEQVYTMQQQVGLGINGYVKLLSLPDEDIALLLLGSDIQDNGGPDWHIIKP